METELYNSIETIVYITQSNNTFSIILAICAFILGLFLATIISQHFDIKRIEEKVTNLDWLEAQKLFLTAKIKQNKTKRSL